MLPLRLQTKKEASVAIVGAISDVVRHLRKSVHLALDNADLGVDVIKWNKKFHELVDECLVELSSKVGDASSIFDIMAGMKHKLDHIASFLLFLCHLLFALGLQALCHLAVIPLSTDSIAAIPMEEQQVNEDNNNRQISPLSGFSMAPFPATIGPVSSLPFENQMETLTFKNGDQINAFVSPVPHLLWSNQIWPKVYF